MNIKQFWSLSDLKRLGGPTSSKPIIKSVTNSISGAFLIAGIMVSGNAVAAGVGPSDVKFAGDDSQVIASVSGDAGDAASGRKVFSNRKLGNCLACHINSDMQEFSFHGEIGPSLDGVSERYDASQLRAILVDSKRSLSEGTMMPGFYSLNVGARLAGKFKDKTILSAQQVEDVLAYLQTLK